MTGAYDEAKAARRELGAFLKGRRELRGFSQNDVAKALGHSSPQAVSNWERGVVAPSVHILATLAPILEIPSNDLVRAAIRYQARLYKKKRDEAVRVLKPQPPKEST
jgi:transcriptional regulator with XRE-family HTH domain